MSIRQFLSLGIEFCQMLHMHHSIEEQRIFPQLARRMPAFRRELLLLTQHKEIHKGMDKMEDYLEECRRGQQDFQFRVLREKMDSFGEVLWAHLDEEVKELGGRNMAKYWTKEEMSRIPF
jgi:hemerythrin-like domain-containing protein